MPSSGVFHASAFPAMTGAWGAWAPPLERTKLNGLSGWASSLIKIENMLNFNLQWTEQAWGRWSYSLSLVTSLSTLDGQQSSMWLGRISVKLSSLSNQRPGQVAWSGFSCGSFLWPTPHQRCLQFHLIKILILNAQHPYISNEEKKHIEESLGLGEVNKFAPTPLLPTIQGRDVSGRKLPIPWTQILSSAQAKSFGVNW